MSEFRQDRTTGNWVIIAAERGQRPHSQLHQIHRPESVREFDLTCPFCPGNEMQLPGILFEIPNRSPPGWKVRAIPNKYPVVQLSAPVPQTLGNDIAMTAQGSHEVVIESPKHDDNPASFSDDQIAALVSVYRRRFSELLALPDVETVILFRNHGASSGASLRHPHSQIIALGMRPPRLRSIEDWMWRRWNETGRCVTCDLLDAECANGKHVVEDTQAFTAIVPFAATVPFEIWIVPKRHCASFPDLSEAELTDFGRILRSVLHRLKAACDDPPYNFASESFDFLGHDAQHAHWRLRIAPELVTWGGFELATGIPINPSSPDRDAALLRSMTPFPT